MKKKIMVLTAMILCIAILLIPMQAAAAPEAQGSTLYISEVKVGMGETSEEAAKELLAEGFTILSENSKYADLNEGAGTGSALKEGPTDKIVYLGYKTTTNPKEAITDLAVMNMNGGYSVEDYEVLMANHLEGEIKPFVERFIVALKEYRANYKKPADTLNHKRADYYRQMLNKLTDDDTGGKPIGDLLLNETKYELGDDRYNALSDEEKKNHADIVTLLMQGNGQAVMLIESLLAKAADSADDTWMDRMGRQDLDEMKAQIKKDDPTLTTEADVNAELDKRYYDTAMKLIEKQASFIESLDEGKNYEAENALINKEDKTEKVKADLEKLSDGATEEEAADVAEDMLVAEGDMVSGVKVVENMVITQYLAVTDYGDESMLDFLMSDSESFSESNIRQWYPIAAALSDGQIAALDFLSLQDLIAVAVTDEAGFNDPEMDKFEQASVYQDVDREIYEPGGVALTNAALRGAGISKEDPDNTEFSLSKLGKILWGCTGAGAIGIGGSLIAAKVIAGKSVPASLTTRVADATEKIRNAKAVMEQTVTDSFYINHPKFVDTLQKSAQKNLERGAAELKEANEAIDAAKADIAARSSFCKYLAAGFAVITALLAGWSLYTTITELLEYYKVTFTPIPRYIVDEADITETVNGVTKVINNQTAYYKVVRCNRKEGSSDVEKDNYRVLGTANDLNGDVGKQWLALYSVKYANGHPILADSQIVQKGSDKLPKGYETGIHRFGEGAAFNLTSKYYCYNDGPDGTYVYFKNDTETVSAMTTTKTSILDTVTDPKNTGGSIISAGSLALGIGIGLLLGAGIAALIIIPIMKKKNETEKAV